MKTRIKKNLKRFLPKFFQISIGKKYRRFKAKLHHKNLTSLAEIYQSDKWGKHSYTPIYQSYFQDFKNKKINVLEIGIGGYSDPTLGGASLRMWKSYFPSANIFGIDIYNKQGIEEKRISTFQGSQDNEEFLINVVKKIGEISIIIDDGSHRNDHVIKSFEILFPHLKSNGLYVIEDVQTSYWPEMGGSTDNMETSYTTINYFKSLIHGLNHKEFLKKDYTPNYYDKHITGIQFYHNLIIINKGDNTEESNLLVNNDWPS